MGNKLIKNKDFISQRGASLIEVILSITLVLVLVPFMYFQIADMNNSVKDITRAKQIVNVQNDAVNFMRVNYADFDDDVTTQLSNAELAEIAPMASYGFFTKTSTENTVSIELLLGFKPARLGNVSDYRIASIAKYIGNDAALVHDDNTAYAKFWAIKNNKFAPGDLVYRITHDFSTEDTRRYLHRSIAGETEFNLNQMQRDLDMGQNKMYNVGNIDAVSLKVTDGSVYTKLSAGADGITTNYADFSKGAVINNSNMTFSGTLTVLGDVYASTVKSSDFSSPSTTVGHDVTVTEDFFVEGNLYLGQTQSGDTADIKPIIQADFNESLIVNNEHKASVALNVLTTLEAHKLVVKSDTGRPNKITVVSSGGLSLNGNSYNPNTWMHKGPLRIGTRDSWFVIVESSEGLSERVSSPYISIPSLQRGWFCHIACDSTIGCSNCN